MTADDAAARLKIYFADDLGSPMWSFGQPPDVRDAASVEADPNVAVFRSALLQQFPPLEDFDPDEIGRCGR